jgi:predicted lysophospholipase L1 biosynthesis ABC-type transport system permease subunit
MAASVPPPPASPIPELPRLGRFALGNLLGLLLEGFLGVGLAAYVSLASPPTFVQLFASTPLLTAHIVLGFLLVVAAALFLRAGWASGVPGLPWRAAVVLLLVLVALLAGFAYTFTLNDAFASGMAVAFLLAFVVQLWSLIVLRRGKGSSTGSTPAPP